MGECTAVERWLPVPGYVGYYEVSDQGRVRSLDRAVCRCNDNSVRRIRGVVLALTVDPKGYLRVSLHKGGVQRSGVLVHQLVLFAFVGPRPDFAESCHENGIKSDCSRLNLRWDTGSANSLDKQRHGTDHERNKTHCPYAHALKVPNLVAHALIKGHRYCLTCARTRANQQYAKKRGFVFDFTAVADRHYARIMSGQ